MKKKQGVFDTKQGGIERSFSFLKDPVIVNSVFLKKPERFLGERIRIFILFAHYFRFGYCSPLFYSPGRVFLPYHYHSYCLSGY